jgi:hypothetical protein
MNIVNSETANPRRVRASGIVVQLGIVSVIIGGLLLVLMPVVPSAGGTFPGWWQMKWPRFRVRFGSTLTRSSLRHSCAWPSVRLGVDRRSFQSWPEGRYDRAVVL